MARPNNNVCVENAGWWPGQDAGWGVSKRDRPFVLVDCGPPIGWARVLRRDRSQRLTNDKRPQFARMR